MTIKKLWITLAAFAVGLVVFIPGTAKAVASPCSPASITSDDHTIFTVGVASTFTVTTSPAATVVSKTGSFFSNVTFTDKGDGTATIAGTPLLADMGLHQVTITTQCGSTPDIATDISQ